MPTLNFGWYVVIAAVLVAFGFGTGWKVCNWRNDAIQLKKEQAQAADAFKRGEAATEIDTTQVKNQEAVRVIYRTIYQRIPSLASSTVFVSNGFGRVHDAAATAVDPGPASPTDGTPAYPEDFVAGVVAENYETYNTIKSRLEGAQDYINRVCHRSQ